MAYTQSQDGKTKTHPLFPWLRYNPVIDWIEDFHKEDGNYTNVCHYCKCHFLGCKRRVICKGCAVKLEDAPLQGRPFKNM